MPLPLRMFFAASNEVEIGLGDHSVVVNFSGSPVRRDVLADAGVKAILPVVVLEFARGSIVRAAELFDAVRRHGVDVPP